MQASLRSSFNDGQISHVLQELYLTAFTTSNAAPPDLSVLLPNAATLRSLVIDVPGMPVATTEVWTHLL